MEWVRGVVGISMLGSACFEHRSKILTLSPFEGQSDTNLTLYERMTPPICQTECWLPNKSCNTHIEITT